MDYKSKYLKYKNKYLNLKSNKMIGGSYKESHQENMNKFIISQMKKIIKDSLSGKEDDIIDNSTYRENQDLQKIYFPISYYEQGNPVLSDNQYYITYEALTKLDKYLHNENENKSNPELLNNLSTYFKSTLEKFYKKKNEELIISQMKKIIKDSLSGKEDDIIDNSDYRGNQDLQKKYFPISYYEQGTPVLSDNKYYITYEALTKLENYSPKGQEINTELFINLLKYFKLTRENFYKIQRTIINKNKIEEWEYNILKTESRKYFKKEGDVYRRYTKLEELKKLVESFDMKECEKIKERLVKLHHEPIENILKYAGVTSVKDIAPNCVGNLS